jgi:hypothetical protein
VRQAAERTYSGLVNGLIPFRGSTDEMGVVKVSQGKGEIAAIGPLTGIRVGDFVTVVGTESQHPQYGMRVKARHIHVSLPDNLGDAINWMWRHFDMDRVWTNAALRHWMSGGRTLNDLYQAIQLDRQEALKLLSPNTQSELCSQGGHYYDHAADGYPKLRAYLQRFYAVSGAVELGLTTQEAQALFRALGSDALKRLREDPYTAYYYVEGLPFGKVDKIYLSDPKHDVDDDYRVRAVIVHTMRDRTEEGHTAIYYDDLVDYMAEKHPSLPRQKLIDLIDSLTPDQIVAYASPGGLAMLQPRECAQHEQGIAAFIKCGQVPSTSELREGERDAAPYEDD